MSYEGYTTNEGEPLTLLQDESGQQYWATSDGTPYRGAINAPEGLAGGAGELGFGLEGLLEKQLGLQQDAFKQSLVDVSSPGGSVTYTPIGGGRFRQEQSLSPALQTAFNQTADQNIYRNALVDNILKGAGNQYRAPLAFWDLPDAPSLEGTEFARDQVIDELFGQAQRKFNPIFEDQNEALQQKLSQEGNVRGTPLFEKQFENLRGTQNDTLLDAFTNAVLQGGGEQSRLFGLQSQARGNALNEKITERNQPLNEISTLLSQNVNLGGIPQAPNAPLQQTPNLLNAGLGAARLASNNYFDQQRLDQQQQQYEQELDASRPNYGAAIGGALAGGIGSGLGDFLGSLFKS